MASSRSVTGVVSPTAAGAGKHLTNQLPDQDVQHRKLEMALEVLDEIEAYRCIDEFFLREGELLEMMEVLGISDEAVLQEFLQLGFTPRTAPAIEMIPVVFVAWASGEVTSEEAAASINAIHDSQLVEFPKTWPVVQTWLDSGPRQELWGLWSRYTRCRLDSLSGPRKDALHAQLIGYCYKVARASGGWLGIGSICQEEQVVLDAIDSVILGSSIGSREAEFLVR